MSDPRSLSAMLATGIKACHLNLAASVQEKLIQYIELLSQWNKVHNLTAIRDPKDMIHKHVLDSLSLVPYLHSGKVVDVGTGAGVPGIPLALALSDLEFTLLDSNQKKITFVQHVILSLKLTNVRAICTRVEAYQPPEPFEWVVSRAFASLSDFIRLSQHLCQKEGRMIAMKGVIDPAEVATISSHLILEAIQPVKVPGVEASRTLVFITKNKQGENGEQ